MTHPKSPERPTKTVTCPQCGGPSLYSPDNPFRPFCCERCKWMDLGAWANERFTLPEQAPDNDPDFQSS